MVDASQLPSRIRPDGGQDRVWGLPPSTDPGFIGPPPGRASGARRATSKLSMRPSFYRALDGPRRGDKASVHELSERSR
jgi:hypothetical protein